MTKQEQLESLKQRELIKRSAIVFLKHSLKRECYDAENDQIKECVTLLMNECKELKEMINKLS